MKNKLLSNHKFPGTYLLLALLAMAACVNKVDPPDSFGPLPNKPQTQWHQTEFYAFIHFTINTFTDKEWGFGDESPELFNPTEFDAEQIVLTAKNAGMKGLVLTTKHHDGFCLWPTQTTEHNISKSPFRNGEGDMVKEFVDACRKHGLKVGMYLSPWDRNNPHYGTPEYIGIFRAQLKELLTQYGEVFEVWFDGANGGTGYYGGANEDRKIDRTTYYDWDNTFAMIRELQPNAAIFSDIGPDARWVGTERGYSGDPCWHRYTPHGREEGVPPGNGATKYWESLNGHREGEFWMPAETNTSIRPGWFYHASQDERVKTPERLVKLYYESIGHGTTCILNLPPDRRGLIHENDIKSLESFKAIIDETFEVDLAKKARVSASNERGNSKRYAASNVLDGDQETYWATDDGVKTPELILEFPEETSFNVVNIREYIPLGQKIWGWALDIWDGQGWKELVYKESIGYKRLWKGAVQTTSKIRFRITEAAGSPAITKISVHKEPVRLITPEISRGKDNKVTMMASGTVYYSLDGSEPTLSSPRYSVPFDLFVGGLVKAKVFHEDQSSETATARFDYAKTGWSIVSFGSEKADFGAGNAIDDDLSTRWESTEIPDQLVVDFGETLNINAFIMTPRRDRSKNGLISRYELYLSADNQKWEKVMAGEFSNIFNHPIPQYVSLDGPRKGRYMKFVVKDVAAGTIASLSELGVMVVP